MSAQITLTNQRNSLNSYSLPHSLGNRVNGSVCEVVKPDFRN